MDFGMANRLSKIFNSKTNKTVMLAVDHGYFQGPTTGLENPKDTIEKLIPHCDAVSPTKGILLHCMPNEVKVPVIIMLIGILLFSGSLYLISLKGFTKLGLITPIGGTAFIVSWVLLAINIYKLP